LSHEWWPLTKLSFLSWLEIQESHLTTKKSLTRRVWRYQRGNQNLYIEEEQTKQWSKEKLQTDKEFHKKLQKYVYLKRHNLLIQTWTVLIYLQWKVIYGENHPPLIKERYNLSAICSCQVHCGSEEYRTWACLQITQV